MKPHKSKMGRMEYEETDDRLLTEAEYLLYLRGFRKCIFGWSRTPSFLKLDPAPHAFCDEHSWEYRDVFSGVVIGVILVPDESQAGYQMSIYWNSRGCEIGCCGRHYGTFHFSQEKLDEVRRQIYRLFENIDASTF